MKTTLAEIRSLLKQLDGAPADVIESELLECKPWDPGRLKEQLREVREAAVGMANQSGGVVLLGVHDRKRTRADALRGVGDLAVETIRKSIFDGTDPPLLVDVEELVEPEARLVAIHVPKGYGVFTTREGVAKIRVGKETKPLTGSALVKRVLAAGEGDRTALPADGATMADLDPEEIKRFQTYLVTEGRKPALAGQTPAEMLANLGLVRGNDVTIAAVMLLGRSAAIGRWVPQHEIQFTHYRTATRYDAPFNLRGPLMSVMDALRGLFEARMKVSLVETRGFEELALPDLTWWVAREAILNAVVHRDYFLNQSVYVEVRPGRIDVVSPGGLLGGITPQNILRHAPFRRNPLLAEAFEAIGWVNRRGMGVDRIHEELLRLGKGMPRYEADESTVRLALPTKTHDAFARFVVKETREGRNLDLDDLLVLRALADRGQIDRWSGARALQGDEDEAAAKLVDLRERGFIVPHGRGRGTTYRLARQHSDLLLGRQATDEALDLDGEAVRLRVQAVMIERGSLTNADVRRISGFSRTEVLRLMRELREERLVAIVGRGRSAHYVPGPALKQAPRAEARPKVRK